MANSANIIGQFKDEVEQTATEVAKDVKDGVGQMIEQGLQSVAGKTLTPQQIQQKQLEEQKKLVEARRKIKFYQDTEVKLKQIREEKRQKDLQRIQQEEEERQKKKLEEEQKKKIIISPAKKTPQFPGQPLPQREEIARTRQEIGKGHGVGG